MKDIQITNVRNFSLLGHTGSGKTTLLDAILHKLGANDRQGSPENGTSAADWTDEEKQHQITMWAKSFDLVYTTQGGRAMELVAMDTPGYADFYGQVLAATAISDSGLIVVDAVSGVQVGTHRAWKECQRRTMPRAIVISGIDKENADFYGVLAAIQANWGSHCVPVSIPTVDHQQVFDVMAAKEVPDEIAERHKQMKGALVEHAAETDDALIEKYLNGEPLSAEEIAAGLHGSVHDGVLIPVFAVSGKTNLGLDALLEGISLLLPSPPERPVKDAAGETVPVDVDAPFSGFVWRSQNDPFAGQVSFVRVYGGTLRAGQEIYNPGKDQKEKVGHLLIINGKKQEEIDVAHAGDVVAIPKLKGTTLNDTLCAPGQTRQFAPIAFPAPTTAYAVFAKQAGDEDKLATALHRVAEEDATIHVERNNETNEMILSGLGDQQLESAVERMRERNHVDVELRTPQIAYRETATALGEGHHKHKKQSGGRGQYGEVYLRVEPRDPADEEWFVNAIVGGVIPGNFIPAVQKGLQEGLQRGAVAHYPVMNTKITVYDGSYHDVDSSEVAFKIAAARALRDGLSKAKPVLLEPVMQVRVTVPDQFMGDITGDLNHKRGRILGVESEEGMQVITADVPQAEVFRYSSELRSMTGGRGSFEMEFSRYDVVPANIAQKVAAAVEREEHEDD
jgi:elongation factor G